MCVHRHCEGAQSLGQLAGTHLQGNGSVIVRLAGLEVQGPPYRGGCPAAQLRLHQVALLQHEALGHPAFGSPGIVPTEHHWRAPTSWDVPPCTDPAQLSRTDSGPTKSQALRGPSRPGPWVSPTVGGHAPNWRGPTSKPSQM